MRDGSGAWPPFRVEIGLVTGYVPVLDGQEVRYRYFEDERAIRLADARDKLHGDMAAVDDIGDDVIGDVRIRLKQFAIGPARTFDSSSIGAEAGGSLDGIGRVQRNNRVLSMTGIPAPWCAT